jgi:hypothetical protein
MFHSITKPNRRLFFAIFIFPDRDWIRYDGYIGVYNMIWILTSLAWGASDCPMHEVLRLRGDAQALEERFGPAPFDPEIRSPPPPNASKEVYGSWSQERLVTQNFIIAWREGEELDAVAIEAAEALERSWDELIRERDWPMPASADSFLLWVFLDPRLEYSAYTVPMYTQEYPEGYAVIYVNPAWSDDPAVFDAMLAHEFMHAIQYAMRPQREEEDEYWYWEASAQWAPKLVFPDSEGYASSSQYYSDFTWYTYSSLDNAHQYGMFLLNAYLEEKLMGDGGMKRIWESSRSDPSSWDSVISTASLHSVGDIWGGFAAEVSNEGLSDEGLYEPVYLVSPLVDGISEEVKYLGTHYFLSDGDLSVSASGDVVLSSPSGWGDEVSAGPGEIVGVTGLGLEPVQYVLSVATGGFDPTAGSVGTDFMEFEDEGYKPATCSMAGDDPEGWAVLVGGLLFGLRWKRRCLKV